MEEKKFMSLGTIVLIKGSVKKLMIIARGAFTNIKGEQHYFDYGACTYPEGIIGDTMLYFNGTDIQSVVYEGYKDADEELMQKNLKEYIEHRNVQPYLSQRQEEY